MSEEYGSTIAGDIDDGEVQFESAISLNDLYLKEKREIKSRVFIKRLELTNYRSYEHFVYDFINPDGSVKKITGLYGPNGSGKSTMLEAIELMFSRYFGRDPLKTKASLSKYIRNVNQSNYLYADEKDFEIKATFVTSLGHEYESVLSRSNIVNGVLPFHHDDVVSTVMHQCYKTRYDYELKHFQLKKAHWHLFKQLFEAVTGYIVEERNPEANFLGATIDLTNQFEGMGHQTEYIMGLTIHKPCETITDKECSDGEKKIIKNFTTMLNSDFTPSILLIDNVEMHVQLSRHASLIESIEKCFPESQIIFTTHSPLIISKFPQSCLFDLGARTDRGEENWKSKMNKIVENAAIVAGGLDFSEAERAIGKLPKDQARIIAKNFIDECYRISIRDLNGL